MASANLARRQQHLSAARLLVLPNPALPRFAQHLDQPACQPASQQPVSQSVSQSSTTLSVLSPFFPAGILRAVVFASCSTLRSVICNNRRFVTFSRLDFVHWVRPCRLPLSSPSSSLPSVYFRVLSLQLPLGLRVTASRLFPPVVPGLVFLDSP